MGLSQMTRAFFHKGIDFWYTMCYIVFKLRKQQLTGGIEMEQFFVCPLCGNDKQDSFVKQGFVMKCPCGLVDGVGVFDTRPANLRTSQPEEK